MHASAQDAPWRSAGVVAGLVAVALILVLLLPSQLLLSCAQNDLISGHVSSRAFFAETVRAGHLPLWNPFTYAGESFVGGFESAIFYPLNLLFLALPLGPALNFSLLLHLIILGWGMERWAIRRGLHPCAAGFAGFLTPLSGAVFPHFYAGHLSNLCTMAWAPWIFLGLESWTRQGGRRGLLLATAAICLQILAGHVQYFFYTALAAGIQAVVLAVAEANLRWRAPFAVAGCYLAGALLGAVQLVPGLAASTEGVRQQKLDYAVASMFSFPPENFLTFIAPGFFGSLGQPLYWGRCYLWEMSLFIGTASLPLIVLAVCSKSRCRQAYLDLAVAAMLLLLALGVHTPLFDPLYNFAPGFGRFRGWSKFTFPATLFLVMIAATGVDFLLREKKTQSAVALGAMAFGFVTALAALFLIVWPETLARALRQVASSKESYLPQNIFTDPNFVSQSGLNAGLSLGLSALVLIASGAILFFIPQRPVLRWALPGLALIEMVGFAAGQVAFSTFSDAMPVPMRQFVAAHPGDYRVLDLIQPNNGFLLGAGDLWGNNPSGLRRYIEFMTFTQGGDPDHAEQYLAFNKVDPLYALLRFRYAFLPSTDGVRIIESPTPPLPRLLLVSSSQTLSGRDAIFSALRQPGFDSAKEVLLENNPDPAPQANAIGSARLISESPDELIVEAETDKPALLLITDLYSRDWHAEPLPGSVQQNYQLVPADYVLRAVPLQAGHHRLRIIYAPSSVPIGVALSVVAWGAWIALFMWWSRSKT
jgi:hypothetical protein